MRRTANGKSLADYIEMGLKDYAVALGKALQEEFPDVLKFGAPYKAGSLQMAVSSKIDIDVDERGEERPRPLHGDLTITVWFDEDDGALSGQITGNVAGHSVHDFVMINYEESPEAVATRQMNRRAKKLDEWLGSLDIIT